MFCRARTPAFRLKAKCQSSCPSIIRRQTRGHGALLDDRMCGETTTRAFAHPTVLRNAEADHPEIRIDQSGEVTSLRHQGKCPERTATWHLLSGDAPGKLAAEPGRDRDVLLPL